MNTKRAKTRAKKVTTALGRGTVAEGYKKSRNDLKKEIANTKRSAWKKTN